MEHLRAMPLFLRVILFFTAIFSCVALVILILGLAGQLDYSIGGYAANREEWLRLAAPLWAFLIVTMGGIAYALWTRRTWARQLVMLMWVVLGGYALALYATANLSLEVMLSTLVRVLIFGGFCLWYFYFKSNVVAYFKALAKK